MRFWTFFVDTPHPCFVGPRGLTPFAIAIAGAGVSPHGLENPENGEVVEIGDQPVTKLVDDEVLANGPKGDQPGNGRKETNLDGSVVGQGARQQGACANLSQWLRICPTANTATPCPPLFSGRQGIEMLALSQNGYGYT